MSEDKSFHIHAPVTGQARRPKVESLTAGTNRLLVKMTAIVLSFALAKITTERYLQQQGTL